MRFSVEMGGAVSEFSMRDRYPFVRPVFSASAFSVIFRLNRIRLIFSQMLLMSKGPRFRLLAERRDLFMSEFTKSKIYCQEKTDEDLIYWSQQLMHNM